jgi:molecular chaperone GrpE
MKKQQDQNEKKDLEKKEGKPVMGEKAPSEELEMVLEEKEPSLPPEETSDEEIPLEEQLAALEVSYKEMEQKAEEYLDGWQRSRAEFANYKKRVLKENSDIHQLARGEVIKIYLDIADDLERALQDRPQNDEWETWAEGIEIILQKLRTRLEAEGVKPMNAMGEEFDPNLHEALMKEESEEFESGKIIEVMQEGYWIGDKVLRPALVRVAA